LHRFHIFGPTENEELICVRCLAVMLFSLATEPFAVADPGDAEKAREMLVRIVVVVQQDESAAVQMYQPNNPALDSGRPEKTPKY
jgi:hypothetical protein